jgi:gliding motility-associated-like protein
MFKKGSYVMLLLYSIVVFSQGEANNWYFGNHAGLSFASGSPVALTDGQLVTDEGCATISTASGQLMFYTDGTTVYNKNHTIMMNGTNLMGSYSSNQSATIVPKPGSTTLFYIFTTDAENGSNGLRYSIVDMNMDNGNGAVTSDKNVLIYTPVTEALSVTKHGNGQDYWIISRDWNNINETNINRFIAYQLTSSGLNFTPVTSSFGNYFSYGMDRGSIKISPSGSKLAYASYNSYAQLFNFNNSTGVVSNQIILSNDPYGTYGAAFSADETVLYMSNEEFHKIYQYNLNAANIPNSVTIISEGYIVGQMQLGPDNKIYLVNSYPLTDKLSVINNPSQLGLACDLQIDAIDLAGNFTVIGLPSFNQSFFFSPSINVTSNCVGDPSVFNFVTNQTVVSATWDFGDGSTSTSLSPSHTYANPGTYNVSVSVVTPFGTGTKNTTITIFAKPTLLADTVSLKQCDDNNDGFSAFNLNQITPSLVANATGLTITFHEELLQAQEDTGAIVTTTAYSNAIVSNDVIYARVENENGCYKTAQINLHVATTSIPTSFQITKIACDDLASGSNTDGIASFDFSDATTQIQALYPAGQQLIVTFYENLTDALAEQNAITNTSNYSNISYPNSQNIYVRVDSQINNECLGLGHHITLNVERIPSVQPLTLKHCDDNHDGIFDFDTTHLQSLLLNGLTNVEVSYTDQNGLPLTSPLPNPFITTSQTLTALVKNNFGNHCDYTTTVQFVVDDLPVATSINTNDITFCSNQNTVSVVTTTFEATILGSQTGMIVNYVDANTNSLSSPLPNPFVTPQQTISAQVINTANAACKTTVAIPIVIHSLPNISLIGDELICSDNPNFTKIINAGLLNSATQNQHTYTWYLNNSLLNNQTNYSLTVNTEGVYKVEVKNSYGCVESRIITVTSSNKAVVDSLIVTDLVDENSIEVILSSASHGNYMYSLDGVYFQSSATFSNILPGIYTVYIKDLKGCGTLPKEVSVLGIPKYFTPNGDGINDYWNMVGVNHKFNAKSTIFIYDRYGKLLYQTTPLSSGWDGTYNGQPMTSSDYWYSVLLEDGRVIKGNFSLKR